MRTHRFASLAVWALLGWGLIARGGNTFLFLFWTYSFIVAYGWAVRWFGLQGVRVSRDVRTEDGTTPPDGAFTVGEDAIVEIALTRPAPLPIPWLIVREKIGEAEHDRLHGPWLTTKAVYRYALPLPKRGVYAFEPAELWAGDPFGIVQQRVRVRTGRVEVAAAPRPRPLGYETVQLLLTLGEGARGSSRRGGDERTELRAYREGDPLTRVLWKLAARTDDWFVRQPERSNAADEVTIVVESPGPEEASRLDGVAEAAAGVAVVLGSRRRPFRLSVDGDAGGSGGWRRALAAMTVATGDEAGSGASAGPWRGQLRGALPARSTAAVVVCASMRPDTAALCREWQAAGREVLVLLARGGGLGSALPEEWATWLHRGGVKVVELTESGERLLSPAERGARRATERFPS
ncbi:DUF58 domain-containing protein [Paenibacillus sp. TRM 82003]|nr:DUF58 domain-containing protein [Paenibacillus sp. TRM 82003]